MGSHYAEPTHPFIVPTEKIDLSMPREDAETVHLIHYGFLEPEDYDALVPIFKFYGGEVPDPKLSRVAYASEGGEIIGFYCLQLVAHAEPLWVHPRFRGSPVAARLIQMINEQRKDKRAYVICDTEESQRMCEKLGLRRVESPVYYMEG